jgi:hypothetical protein
MAIIMRNETLVIADAILRECDCLLYLSLIRVGAEREERFGFVRVRLGDLGFERGKERVTHTTHRQMLILYVVFIIPAICLSTLHVGKFFSKNNV